MGKRSVGGRQKGHAAVTRSEQAGEGATPGRYDPGYVEVAAAGVAAVGEFRCVGCGYGVIVHRALPSCPMCGGAAWEQAAWSPFSRTPADRILQ
jgi:rubrerythrin